MQINERSRFKSVGISRSKGGTRGGQVKERIEKTKDGKKRLLGAYERRVGEESGGSCINGGDLAVKGGVRYFFILEHLIIGLVNGQIIKVAA